MSAALDLLAPLCFAVALVLLLAGLAAVIAGYAGWL